MYQIQLKFKGQIKKITVAKSLPSSELNRLIIQCFNLSESVVGVTDRAGKFYQLSQLTNELSASKQTFSLVTAKDLNQQSMSFASEYNQKQSKQQYHDDIDHTEDTLQIPTEYETKCMGIIGNIQLFQQLVLTEERITVVACYTKIKPSTEISYQYYLYQNQTKNSVVVYSGTSKVCEFYIGDWNDPNPQIDAFIQSLTGQSLINDKLLMGKSGQFKKKSKVGEGEIMQSQIQNQLNQKDEELKQSFIQNLNRLLEEGQLADLQYYKLKSQVLQNPREFIRKYQMGTHQGLRGQSRGQLQSKQERRQQERRERGRSANKNKRYQIPIIVRKYNNVVQKISTSYPLTLEQQQSINLILELQLKGLITQKQAGLYKSQILQQDQQTFKIFRQYFEDAMDQIQLAAKLKRRRQSNGQRQQSREKSEHDMRLLIKYAKQNSYELLRKLALQGNRHVLGAMATFRSSKNAENFINKLQKIAHFYRAKEDLQSIQSV